MSDEFYILKGTSLNEIAEEIHNDELGGRLSALVTRDGQNYAVVDTDKELPINDLVVLRAEAAPPAGADKICDGTLSLNGQVVDVVAFREDTLPDRGGPPTVM